jgi:hypothetical protein
VGCGVWGVGCGRCGGVGSLLTFDIPQTALVATLDTYDFIIFLPITSSSHFNIFYLMENYILYTTHGMLMLLLTADPDLFGLDGGGWCCFLHI